MKEINKNFIKRAKEIIDSGLEKYPNYHSRKDVIDCIRADRVLLNTIALLAINKEIDLITYINNGNHFNIIDIDDNENSRTIDISRSYATLEVFYTVVIDEDEIHLTNNMAIRLVNDPDNEVWLYEDELSELY